ncbi:redox-sensitive bicupin YhaK (pirin superfamily) [Natronospira proteinivora]|uniref:Redox-sensitive bicupin YhaK (Pirin superfamily) n=1 Tax=Natronospira proteinivora TaxID=1807133 RepID=A0ABT1G5P1_9GAMM|nr:pirin family protein [Natronospira proteinivora]MCP1726609.1 redox-sensitive bicupin YhaK (pirin superfamily) [Natronospira proteinivora]
MSTQDENREAADPKGPNGDTAPCVRRLAARESDVGGIPVARALPSRKQRRIGAWCFLDHAGPAHFEPGSDGMQVGPHPHTSLQTFTWMIAGELIHRDSLGYEQRIRPGQVNLMTAGWGISHTEASPDGEEQLHAAQLWIALPHDKRHMAPRFDHYPDLPRLSRDHLDLTLLLGEFEGEQAPTLHYSPLMGLDMAWSEAATTELALRTDFEYGILPLEGSLNIDEETFQANELAYLGQGRDRLSLSTGAPGRALLIGGEPMDANITMWWNFVGHSREEVAQAQDDWEAGDARFGEIPKPNRPRMTAPPIPWKRSGHE